MSKRALFTLWGLLFILCAGLGFLPMSVWWMTGLSLLFFVPPAVLLVRARREKDRHTRLLVRNLSALSLGLTVVLLLLSFFTALSSETLGTAVHVILTVVSTPMITGGHWALSLFLWACLLMGSLKK